MFNKIREKNVQLNDCYVSLSTDTKLEEGCGNGDELIEMDTGKKFYFDADGADNSKWVEVGGA